TLDDNNPQAADLYWPESLPWHQAEGHRASTCACMRVGQKPIGFIGFAFRHIAVLTDEQLEFIQALTNQATLSIHLTRLAEEAKQTAISQEQEKAAQQRAVQLTRSNQALKRSLDSLAQQPELGAFLQRVVNEATAQTGAANGHLFLHDTVTHTIALRVATENGGNWRDVTDMALWQQPVPVDFAPALWEAMLEKKPFFEEDFQSTLKPGPHIWEPSITWHRQRGHTRIICAPLVLGEQVLGFLGLSFVGETIFTPDEVELTQALANQATLAIQLTRLAEEAKQVAISQEQEKAAQERAAELAKTNEAIAKTLTTLAASPELDKFLGTILVEMARQLNACKAHLFLYDQATHTLTQRLAIQDGQIYLGVGPNDPEMFAHPVPADMTPGWNAIITSERPLTYDETLPFDESIWWPESLAWHKAQGHKAITCIPMKAGETPIGYIGFCFYDRTVLSDEQLEFMQALANQAIVAIQLTTLAEEAKQAAVLQAQEKAAQQRVAELAKTNEALSQTLNVLTTEPELDRFLGKILTQINEQIGADDAHLFLYDPETHTLRQQVAVQSGQVFPFNAPGDPDIFRQPVPADITQAWQIALNSPKPFVIDQNDPESAAFLWPGTAEWHQSRGHCTTVCACMKVGNQPLGFIGFAFRDCIVLTDEQLEFIQALTNQATLSVHLARLAEQTQSAALTSERNRLAREIHDTLAQAFTGVSLQLEAAKGVLNRNPDEAQTYMTRAGKLARRGLSEARRSVRALRSQALETDTLPKALQTAIQEMTQDSPMQGEFNLIGTPLPLPEDLQTNLLRIGQEAITNALRHAQAQHLILTLQFTREQVRIYITDNGKGCQINAITEVEGFGLLGMRERTLRFGGQFSFKSALGEGTIIDIMIPIEGIG
ncbi:MAG: GAF domain-containing protein, partial [Cyanobacteria bacterium P01_G01_bin.38]